MSADPMTQAPFWSQGLNRYSYVFNNPVNNTDPSGFMATGGESTTAIMGWGAAVTALAAGGGFGLGIGGLNPVTSAFLPSIGDGSAGSTQSVAAPSSAPRGSGIGRDAPAGASGENRGGVGSTHPEIQNKGLPPVTRPPGTSLFDPARGATAQNFQYGGYCHEDGPCHDSIYIADISGGDFARAGTAIVNWAQRFWRWLSPAANALPQIAKASNGEMLGQAIEQVKAFSGTAAQKADLFQQLGSQSTKLSSGSWTAARGVGTEGSHVFLGGAGEALVINPAGQLFRGSLQTGGVSIAGVGRYAIDFAKLTGL